MLPCTSPFSSCTALIHHQLCCVDKETVSEKESSEVYCSGCSSPCGHPRSSDPGLTPSCGCHWEPHQAVHPALLAHCLQASPAACFPNQFLCPGPQPLGAWSGTVEIPSPSVTSAAPCPVPRLSRTSELSRRWPQEHPAAASLPNPLRLPRLMPGYQCTVQFLHHRTQWARRMVLTLSLCSGALL